MPDWRTLIRRRLGDLAVRPEREAEILEEFAAHAESRYRELTSGGVPEPEAESVALAEFGDPARLIHDLRPATPRNRSSFFIPRGGVLRDLRHGIRTLSRSPAFTLVICAVLGLGIGAAVAMFTVVDAAFLRPLGFPHAERLVQIQEAPPAGGWMPVAYPNFLDWRKRSQSFESMAIAGAFQETWRRAGENERIRTGYVAPEFYQTLGVTAAAGRLLTSSDDQESATPALVLSHAFWVSRFGANPSAIGQVMVIDSQPWTIVGVSQPFHWQRTADVFAPVAFAKEKYGLGMRENHSGMGVVARLKPGIAVEQARAEMDVIAAQLAKEYPGANGGNGVMVQALRNFIGGGIRQTALLMFGAVGLLLLVACANVAGLLLARAAARQREMAVRIALGAGRAQIIQQLLMESLLLALGGAAAGMAVAWVSLAGLRTIFPEVENLGGIGLDVRVLAFSLGAAVGTALLFGLAPAFQLARADVADAMKAGGRSAHGAGIRVTTRKVLVVSQVALAVVLSIGAGLLLRSLFRVLHTDPGLRPEHVVMAAIVPPERKDGDISANARMLEEITARLAALPGVQAVGGINGLPFDNADSWGDFYRTDQPAPEAGKLPNGMQAAATSGYFQAMGIPLRKGRLFLPSDGKMPPVKRDIAAVIGYLRSATLVAVINESLARKYWPGEDPVGKSFRFGPLSMNGPLVKIVGVVGDARQLGLDQPVEPQYFFSANQFPMLDLRLVVRAAGDPAALGTAIRAAVAQVQPEAAVVKVATMERLIGDSVSGRRNKVLLLGIFSAVTLLLAALGLYATMAYVVAQRTQEIGVRMALGAAPGDVRSMVVLEGAMLAGTGVVLGLAVALAAGRAVSGLLYGVTAGDAVTYVSASVFLIVIMLAAGYIPARRASRLDPMQALRCE